MQSTIHVYEVRPRNDHRGVDLISDALPFGRLWYTQISDAVDYAKFDSRSHDALIRVYDDAGNVIETHEHIGDLGMTFGVGIKAPLDASVFTASAASFLLACMKAFPLSLDSLTAK